MGLMNALLGNASSVDLQKLESEFSPLLIEGERIEVGFRLIRDMFLFTSRRLILIDKQGLTGSKQEITSIPYKSIEYFSKESAGTLDLDAELKIHVRGMAAPIKKQFGRDQNINEVYQILSRHIL